MGWDEKLKQEQRSWIEKMKKNQEVTIGKGRRSHENDTSEDVDTARGDIKAYVALMS